MPQERYLPQHYMLPDGDQVKDLYVKGAQWQLYTTAQGGQTLAVHERLHQQWIDADCLEPGVFQEAENCLIWCARPGSMISSMEHGPYPMRQEQADAFVRTLRRSRMRLGRISFADALYIGQFSMLLPTFSGGGFLEDAVVLGRWLTGGVPVSVADTARIRRYAPWLTEGTLDRILTSLGLTADAGDAGIIEAPAARAEKETAARPRAGRAQGAFCLPGRPEIERFFREEILHVIDNEEAYRRMGVGFPGASLLYGPPGCGKTYAVEQLTKYLGWPVYEVTSGTIGSKYIHETSRKISEVFDQAIANAPSVIVMDELEAFLSSREHARASAQTHMEEVAEFLRRIPEAAKNRVLIFGMTNMIDMIDKAILRRGRFDNVMEIRMPSREEVRGVLESLLRDIPVQGDPGLDALADRLQGAPMSDVDYVVRQAGRLAVREGRDAVDAELLLRACEGVTNEKRTVRKMGF